MRLINALERRPLQIGRQGENLATRVIFDISDIVEDFGEEGIVYLLIKRPEDTDAYEPSPLRVKREDNLVFWDISSYDLVQQGKGVVELQYVVGTSVVKQRRWDIKVLEGIVTGEESQENYEEWHTELAKIGAQVQSDSAKVEELASLTKEYSDIASEKAAESAAEAAKVTEMTISGTILDFEEDETPEEMNNRFQIEKTFENGVFNLDFKLPYTVSRVPKGGTVGQVLAKKSDEDFDAEWVDPPKGGGIGGGTSSFETDLEVTQITPSNLVILASEKTILSVNYHSYDSNGVPINGIYAIYINGALATRGQVIQGINKIDVTNYVPADIPTSLNITFIDNGNNSVSKNWYIKRVNLGLSTSFDESVIYSDFNNFTFSYRPTGAVVKTLHVLYDGAPYKEISLSESDNGIEQRFPIAQEELTHGAHVVEMYLSATIDGNLIETEHLYKTILCKEEGNSTPIIGCIYDYNIYGMVPSTQYIPLNITYYVLGEENPRVTKQIDSEPPIEQQLDKISDVWVYRPNTPGEHTLKITYGSAELVIKTETAPANKEILPITDGLAFDFNPVGYSNNDNSRLWKDSVNPTIGMSVSNNFDWTNGGYQLDENGEQAFVIRAGTSAEINYTPFNRSLSTYGMNFRVIFKSVNVKNGDSAMISCYDNGVGFIMTPQKATFYQSESKKLNALYCENDVIEFDIDVNKYDKNISGNYVMAYEDGVPLAAMPYEGNISFEQSTPKPIVIGSEDCDIWIYRMKFYTTNLGDEGVLQNFIADARNAKEMNDRYSRNQIFNSANKLTPESIAEACPDLRIIKIECPYFTNDKKDYVKGTNIECIYKGGDMKLDNWKFENCYHAGQGTTSNTYGYAGRNIDIIGGWNGEKDPTGKVTVDPNYITTLTLGNGETYNAKDFPELCKISLSRTSVPNDWFNIKVNIASSENANNALLQKRYDRYLPMGAKTPAMKAAGSNIKNSMEFFNCVVFIRETDEDITTHREFKDNEWHFYAIGNIGDSKKTDNTRVNDPTDPKEFVIEVSDNTLANSTFQTGVVDENGAQKYPISKSEWVRGNVKYDNLYGISNPATNKADGDKVVITSWDSSFEFRYDASGMKDGVATGMVDEEQQEANKQVWRDFYEWVITSSDEQFHNELKDWCLVDSVLYWYLFTERYIMIDSRAKNTFWHYGKCEDGRYRFDMWDYDNDTALGINNSGTLELSYGIEDVDKNENGGYYFNAADNIFWCRIRDIFSEELASLYSQISGNCWSDVNLINEFDVWQAQFPERLWLKDIERKYYRTFFGASIDNSIVPNEGVNPSFLTLRFTGRKKYQRRQFERDQYNYIGTKYLLSSIKNDRIYLRAHKPGNDIKIVPYSDMYLSVMFGNSSVRRVRAKRNVEYTIASSLTNETQIQDGTEIDIYCGSRIKELNNLDVFQIQDNDFTIAEKLQAIKLGGEQINPYLNSVNIGENRLLTKLDVTNCTNLQSLNLGKCTSLKEFYGDGTQISTIKFADNAKLEHITLPSSLTELSLTDMQFLQTIEGDFSNLNSLILNNINYDTLELLNRAIDNGDLRILRITNIDWTLEDEQLLVDLYDLNGFGVAGILPHAYLSGKCHINTPTNEQIKVQLSTYYPDVEFTYGELKKFTVRFFNGNVQLGNDVYTTYNRSVNYSSSGGPATDTLINPVGQSGESYVFWRWYPSPTNITKDTDCFAQFLYASSEDISLTFEELKQNDYSRFVGGTKKVLINGQTIPFKLIQTDYKDDEYIYTFISSVGFGSYRMNPEHTSVGGWAASNLRSILQTYVSSSDEDFAQNVKEVKKMSTPGEDGISSLDKLWIPSASELGCYGAENLGPQYSWFTSNSDRARRKINDTYNYYWLRDKTTNGFRLINNYGELSPSGIGAANNYMIVVGFCI